MLTWHYVTKAAYDSAEVSAKTSDKLFFLSDTKQIMRGTQNFTESVELFTGSNPTNPAVAKLYINSATLEGKMYNGTAWTTVIQPVVTGGTGDTLDSTNTTKPVSGKATADYVAGQLASLSGDVLADLDYNSTTKVISGTMKDGTAWADTITLNGLGCNLTWETKTGSTTQKTLKLKDVGGNVLASVDLDLERFVTDASYDATNKKIILAFDNEDPHVDVIEIPVGDLVDTYDVSDTASVDMTNTNNVFSASVKLSSDTGNILTIVETAGKQGLYAAHQDISGKQDKDTDAVAGNIATFVSGGNTTDSGKKAGGATLAATPDANTLATEAAVEAIRSALATAIDGKISKMGNGDANKVVLSTADGQVARSTMVLGGSEFAAAASQATTLATEAGVVDYVGDNYLAKTQLVTTATIHNASASASDANPVSEKAVLAALEWKTTV